MEELHRVFVGGLFDSITKDELSDRFQTFGDVTDVTIVQKKDGEGNISKTFGYVNLVTTTQKLNRCFAVYGGTKWKGHELKVQLAKEDFITRLQKERDEPVVKKKKKKHSSGPSKTYTDILETTSTMKKIVPGTPVEGERNWVIGKYGRPLPIVHIPKVGGRKVVKVDPSKFCHCLKRIPDVGNDDVNVDTLTWTYDDSETNLIHKKKKRKKHEDNMNSIEVPISNLNAETVDSIGYTEETVNTNGIIEIQTLKKVKKKKREREMKENIPTQFSLADDDLVKRFAEGDVTKQKRKCKDEKLEVVVQNNSGEDSLAKPNAEPVDSIKCSEKKKKKKAKVEETIPTVSTPVDSISTSGVSDDLVGQKKRKHKDKKIEACKQEDREQLITSVEKEKESNKIMEIIEQCPKVEDPELITSGNKKIKKPKYSGTEHRKCEEICIPEMLFFEGVQDDPVVNGKSKENILSTSIVGQLLSGSKKRPPSISSNDQSIDDLNTINDIHKAHDDKYKNSEDSDENDNLFDFEFKDIGGKNRSFLDTLVNNIEVRENVNEINENSGEESEEDSASSSESLLGTEDTKEPVMNIDCVKVLSSNKNKEFKEIKGNDLVVENVEQICIESIDTDKKVNKYKNIEKIDSDKQIYKSKNIECIDSDKRIKKSKILNSNKQEKHALSEEQRKKSLEVRNSQILQNKGLVSKALKDVDKSPSNANRIIFSESDGEEEESMLTAQEADTCVKSLLSDNEEEDLIDGKTSENQTKLFDDTDDEEVTDDEEIIVKPQFQGKEGEKLFKMQRKFGGDGRFKLDERFAEDDTNEEENDDRKDISVEDVIGTDEDLQKEKEMNISVLEQVLGKPISLDKKEHDYRYQRYDPDNIEHEKFEVKVKPPDANAKDDESEIPKVKKTQPVPKLPEVSKDTFYSVNESIKDLFGKEESSSFSFLGSEDVDTPPEDDKDIQNTPEETGNENQSEEVTEEQMERDCEEKVKVPSWKKGLEDMLRSEQNLKENKVLSIENREEADKKFCTYLYFPDGDNRLDIGKRFIRTEEIEEITYQWKAIRRTLTEDYKKKHKDAVRRLRKMREKRFNKH